MYESSTKETKWVCIQLDCSRRPRALEEAHCWNIQAKFYNENFPLVYESDKTRDSLSWRSWCYFEAQVWQRIVALPLLSFSLFFYFIFLYLVLFPFYGISAFWGAFSFLWPFSLFFIPHLGQCSRKWWSSHFYLFTTQWLQLNTRTTYDSIWMPPAVYRDVQWLMSDMYEIIMNGGFSTNTMSTTWSCKAIWQW